MEPANAAKVLEEMDDTSIIKIMVFMKDTETAAIWEALAKKGQRTSQTRGPSFRPPSAGLLPQQPQNDDPIRSLSLPTPAMPGGETRSLTPDQSAALPSATESFLSVMAQVRGDGFPKPRGEAKTSAAMRPAETPNLPANPSGKAGDIDASMTSTLMAVMAQPRIAAGESRKSASTQAASFKNALVGQGGKALSLTEISDNDASPMETPKALANPPGKAPRIVTGEFHKPATTQAVNLKIAPACPSS